MWQERAKALFFMEKKSIREISIMLLKSEKSIYRYLKKLPEYKQEKEKSISKAMGQAKQSRKIHKYQRRKYQKGA